jgi:hypothetical protein
MVRGGEGGRVRGGERVKSGKKRVGLMVGEGDKDKG